MEQLLWVIQQNTELGICCQYHTQAPKMAGEQQNLINQQQQVSPQQVAPPVPPPEQQPEQAKKAEEGSDVKVQQNQPEKDAEQSSTQASQQKQGAGAAKPEGNPRLKDLNERDMTEHFKKQVIFLRDVEDEVVYSSQDALRPLCQLTWMYFDYRKHRQKLGNMLAEMNYAGKQKSMHWRCALSNMHLILWMMDILIFERNLWYIIIVSWYCEQEDM